MIIKLTISNRETGKTRQVGGDFTDLLKATGRFEIVKRMLAKEQGKASAYLMVNGRPKLAEHKPA